MFSITLKFTIDLLVKWFKQDYEYVFLETDALTKEKYKQLNKIDTLKTICCICDFRLDLNSAYGLHSHEMTYLDFVIREEYLF